MSSDSETPPRPRSQEVLDGPGAAVHRAMYRAMGLDDQELSRPLVGVATCANEATPCNLHLGELAEFAKQGVEGVGATPREFTTISVSDAITMGTPGMKYSLVSRELIADSVEAMVDAHAYDALVCIGGCDKSLPGMMMAMLRLDVPGVFVYGGSIEPGRHRGEDISIVEVGDAVGQFLDGRLSERELGEVERSACPGAGSCAGMYTANTMASLGEALGLSLPGSASPTAVSAARKRHVRRSGEQIRGCLETNLTPRTIVDRRALENALTLLQAVGGSTNGVLHLLALAREAEVEIDYDDVERIRRRTPVIANMKPWGDYVMADLHEAGGVPEVMSRLLEDGLLHEDAMTVTGKTLGESLRTHRASRGHSAPLSRPDSPLEPEGKLKIMRGSLAPDGAVWKVSSTSIREHTGPARVFDGEEEALWALAGEEIADDDVIVIRYEGPVGGPGMREMAAPVALILNMGLRNRVALVTDGRFSGGSHGPCIGHAAPEAARGGPLALVENGDPVYLNADTGELDLKVDGDELDRRRAEWDPPEVEGSPRSLLGKYARLVTSADRGAICRV